MSRPPLPDETQAVVPATPSRRVLDGLTLVLVEDDPDCRDVLAFWFESFGATVIAVGSAREALACLELGIPEVPGPVCAQVRGGRRLGPRRACRLLGGRPFGPGDCSIALCRQGAA